MDFLTLQLSKINWRIAIVVLVVVGIAGIFFLNRGSSSSRSTPKADPLSKLPPGVYKSQPSGETLPVPASRRL